ncbi:CRISPR-associated protein Cas4 (plasmid) [Lacticaseibacillus paracasei subsp. tolerans]|nr:CRISPR-associated protein Cas4 [Lacticaseibacillus paracasei subsp. tolerans]
MISGIQHFMYSERQWALIHVEQQWAENFQTFSGQELHGRVDDPFIKEKRNDVIISRSLPVSSSKMGMYGICDAVEWHENDGGVPLPNRTKRYLPKVVEYKRGKSKHDHSDELQLVAYTVCLEEMLNCTLSIGELFYFKTRRRDQVEINAELRDGLKSIFETDFKRHSEPRLPSTAQINH